MVSNSFLWDLFLGRFGWKDQPIVKAWQDPTVSNIIAGAIAVGGALGGFILITYLRKWRYLWTEWFTSRDHKRIGTMYICLAIVMMSRGRADQLRHAAANRRP